MSGRSVRRGSADPAEGLSAGLRHYTLFSVARNVLAHDAEAYDGVPLPGGKHYIVDPAAVANETPIAAADDFDESVRRPLRIIHGRARIIVPIEPVGGPFPDI